MKLDQAHCRLALDALALPPAVLRIFAGQVPHPLLADCCSSPYYVFTSDMPRLREAVVPLWEHGVVVTAYAPADTGGRFVSFSLEAPDELRVIGARFGAVVADLLLALWENDVDDAGLHEVATVFEFNRTAELLQLLEARSAGQGLAGFEAWRRGFLDRFDTEC